MAALAVIAVVGGEKKNKKITGLRSCITVSIVTTYLQGLHTVDTPLKSKPITKGLKRCIVI